MPTDPRAALCDGCAVRDPWEHRCHGGPCPCPECREERCIFDGERICAADLDQVAHEGKAAVLLGQWPVTGTLHWNRRSERWELRIPRPHRADQRLHALPIYGERDVVALIPEPVAEP